MSVRQPSGPSLSHAEVQRVQRYQDRLNRALAARDRQSLRRAKQRVLAAAYAPRRRIMSPAFRMALKRLSWQMAAMLLTRDRAR
ncbi:hypothetical protein H9K75_11805 [Diaphorobacter aerolatus]|uniref:Uncharacterized protein n=2 Tax=Diaphorobacter aerolatus TaxID=1288495 RepID=A0A7H0GQE4_9BURK|nr:hypothetical protein H9K75_11805 [Diaphorobacter aerolatus]